MRNRWMIRVAAALTVLPVVACAAVYDFQSTETSALGDPAFSFALDTSSAVATAGGTSFSGVAINESGTTFYGNTVTVVTPDELASPLFFFIDTDVPGPKLFSFGSGPTIAFNVGTFVIADGFTDGEGQLTISEAGSAAPEPGTWLLMLVGAGGVGSMLRRRRVVQACRQNRQRQLWRKAGRGPTCDGGV